MAYQTFGSSSLLSVCLRPSTSFRNTRALVFEHDVKFVLVTRTLLATLDAVLTLWNGSVALRQKLVLGKVGFIAIIAHLDMTVAAGLATSTWSLIDHPVTKRI